MASNEATIAPVPQADAEGTNKEHVTHHDVHRDNHEEADDGDIKRADVAPNVKGGDLASKWLAKYDGPKPELTDELSNKVRWKVSTLAEPWQSPPSVESNFWIDRRLPHARLLLHLLLSTARQVECVVCGKLRLARGRQLGRQRIFMVDVHRLLRPAGLSAL